MTVTILIFAYIAIFAVLIGLSSKFRALVQSKNGFKYILFGLFGVIIATLLAALVMGINID